MSVSVTGGLRGHGRSGRSRSSSGEPHLDRVAGLGQGDRAAVLRVVDVADVAVAFAALPFLDRGLALPAAVDPVSQGQILESAAGDHGDGLRAAVGNGEAVHLEVGCGQSDGRHRVGRVVRRLGHRDREGQVLLELGLDQRLGVGEVELTRTVVRFEGVIRVQRAHRPAGRHLRRERKRSVVDVCVLGGLAVRGVELGGKVGIVTGDGEVALSPTIVW